MINWFEHLYPYTNVHELNLDWILGTVKAGEQEIKNFIGANVIKYADPITWDISREYEANTVVVDPGTGDAYISVKPVPYGYGLNRIDYWTKIFNYGGLVDTLMAQIATNEGNSPVATRAFAVDDLLFINGILYRAIANIAQGEHFAPLINIVDTTVEEEIHRLQSNLSALSDRVTATETTISHIVNKKILFIGDSITLGYNPDVQGNIIESYAKKYINSAGYTLDTDAFISAEMSAGFVAVGQQGNTFTSLLSAFNAAPREEITDIYVIGGINDAGVTTISETTLRAAIKSFVTYAEANYQNATVHIGCITTSRLSAYAPYDRNNIVRRCYSMSDYGKHVTILNNIVYAIHSIKSFSSDGYHLSPAGQESLAQYLVSGSYTRFLNARVDLNQQIFSNANMYMQMMIKDGALQVKMPEGTLAMLNVPVTCNNSDIFEIGTFDDSLWLGQEYVGSTYFDTCVDTCIFGDGSNFYTVQMKLQVNSGTLYAKFIGVTTNNWVSGTMTQLTLLGNTHTFALAVN